MYDIRYEYRSDIRLRYSTRVLATVFGTGVEYESDSSMIYNAQRFKHIFHIRRFQF